MFIYLASNSVFNTMSIAKLGCTKEPYDRRKTYLTGCPPGLTPSYDIEYIGLWETVATNKEELFELEDEVHDYFLKYRMMRVNPGDSEWFNFQGKIPYEEVASFIKTRSWLIKEVLISEVLRHDRSSQFLRKQYHKNLKYIKNQKNRCDTLSEIQKPIIFAIGEFMLDKYQKSGYVIAPCGSGKTLMCVKGIRGTQKCVICCPSRQIQNQWYSTLTIEGVFHESSIYIVGSSGTTDTSDIRKIFTEDTFCVISTYMSSHLLVDIITSDLQLIVFDEAHHMAGLVSNVEDNGEGRTRKLMVKTSDLQIKRLSLTYTPRFVSKLDTNTNYISMDDDEIFGSKIADLKIRHLISNGVLPDYRLWTLRDKSKKGTGLRGKAECIMEAWDAKEVIRGEEKYILHHLIVFAPTTQDAKILESFFKAKTTETLVLRVGEGDKLERPISRFTSASRAILVNCFVLNEGVDIPIANSVAITYPKQSRGQITQMVLRAGRWYEGKSIFHVIIPTLGDEDLSGFEEVLMALASSDDHIRDEIVIRSGKNSENDNISYNSSEINGTIPECIMIDEYEANSDEIKRCFMSVRKKIFETKESKTIQKLCIEKGIDTSIEYNNLRNDIPELPEDPRPKGVEWYDYLHPYNLERISCAEFFTTYIHPNQLRSGDTYDNWYNSLPKDNSKTLPSLQHITDGFFGSDYTNYNIIIDKFGKKSTRKR